MNELLPGLRHWRTHNPDIDYDAGDLHGGVRAIDIGVICPDEMALVLPFDTGVLAIADSFIRYGDDIGFVSAAPKPVSSKCVTTSTSITCSSRTALL